MKKITLSLLAVLLVGMMFTSCAPTVGGMTPPVVEEPIKQVEKPVVYLTEINNPLDFSENSASNPAKMSGTFTIKSTTTDVTIEYSITEWLSKETSNTFTLDWSTRTEQTLRIRATKEGYLDSEEVVIYFSRPDALGSPSTPNGLNGDQFPF